MPLPVDREAEFQNWYRETANRIGLNPNPDDPAHYYDYRGAFLSGAEPTAESGFHWPSQFKREGHPRLILEGVNTKTGESVAPQGVSPMPTPTPTHIPYPPGQPTSAPDSLMVTMSGYQRFLRI